MIAHRRWFGVWLLLVLALTTVTAWLYRTVPTGNTAQGTFDAILVLGAPAGFHGEVGVEQGWRVDEAVREYRVGRAPRLIVSGGAVANRFIEADVMAAYAERLGVPATAIFEERRARNTMENLSGSEAILRAHGWRSVEVVSSADHLPRAAVLLAHEAGRERPMLLWRVHAAPTPGRSFLDNTLYTAEEAGTTALLRVLGPRIMPVLHGFAVVQHGLGWAGRWIWLLLTGRLGQMER